MAQKYTQKTWVIGLVSVTAALALISVWMRPAVQKQVPLSSATLVEVITVEPREERTEVEAYGTVQAVHDLSIQPEVKGKVIELSPNLVVGGAFDEGDTILKIDPRDYEIVVDQEAANVAKAEFELKREQGRRIIAIREWELLESSVPASDLAKELALREPHLKEKLAAHKAAESKLRRAEIDLERTVLKAPFNGVIVEETVEIGQVIGTSTQVARLVGSDRFRVQVSIPYDRLDWIEIAWEDQREGSPVVVTQEVDDDENLTWTGNVEHLLSNVDPNGRMARLLVQIEDPLGLKKEEEGPTDPLLLGTYVRVNIQGPELDEVFVIPRKALREGSDVWVMNDDDELEIREVKVLSRRRNDVVVGEGLNAGDRVVVSSVPNPLPGMTLIAE